MAARSSTRKRRCFQEFVLIAVYTGLTLEQRTVQHAASNKSGGGGGGGGAKPETTSFVRFCFDRLLAERGQNEMGAEGRRIAQHYMDAQITPNALNPKCGSQWDPRKKEGEPQPDSFEFAVGSIEFRIKPRSAFGVFEFLGTQIKMERGDLPPVWEEANIYADRPGLTEPPRILTTHDDHSLFTVDFTGAECFTQTWFLNETYCVPEKAYNSKRIFSLLAQLIAIQTSATDLSITPNVRIIQ